MYGSSVVLARTPSTLLKVSPIQSNKTKRKINFLIKKWEISELLVLGEELPYTWTVKLCETLSGLTERLV